MTLVVLNHYRDAIKQPCWPLKVGPIGCPETSVNNYKSRLRNIAEARRFNLHRGEAWIYASDFSTTS